MSAKIKVKSPYLVKPHTRVRLAKVSAADSGEYKAEPDANAALQRHVQRLETLQELLTAENKHAVLVVLQGMDTSGKDGTIRHIFTGVNPQACNVTSFKPPTPLEKQHDYLWRAHNAIPRAGTIGIFNRSHYEDVLVPRVHKAITGKVVRQRFRQIVDFEETLAENNVTILKFFLHISRDEQTRRLEARLADVDKRWKVSEADFVERHLWSEYEAAYEDAISNTSRKFAPWFLIPSDHKWYRNVAISEILVKAMNNLKMKYPKPTFDPASIRL
ncbi:MAG TPA: PPK2 family polyphosphate kinase [Acidisarcina sp.]|nr:PPK2 family polyphosphate kinase [Acidisarcina sp.]